MAEYVVYDARDGMCGAKAAGDGELMCEYRERVVRCRDCRYLGHDSWGVEVPVCRRWPHMHSTREDGFCSFGFPREES